MPRQSLSLSRLAAAGSTGLATVLLSALLASPVMGKSCSGKSVSARGEPARFLWVAKTQARANWRRKVRAISGLGIAYENWKDAEEATERCIRSEKSSYCIFSGVPCRR